MVKWLIKTIKHGIKILFATPKHFDSWDEQLARVMFGYQCGIQANTKFFPFMILIGCTLCFQIDNYLQALITTVDDATHITTNVEYFIKKMKLVASIHENVLLKVEQAQNKF
jgi:hypothetical protein